MKFLKLSELIDLISKGDTSNIKMKTKIMKDSTYFHDNESCYDFAVDKRTTSRGTIYYIVTWSSSEGDPEIELSELSDKIKELINQNEKYKKILNKYKSYQQSVLPTEEDIFILLKSYLSDSGLSYKFTWRIVGTLQGKFLFYGGDRDITEKRFDEFRMLGILEEMIDVCASFDLSEFPEDIYKRYVFLSF